jgi:hypothetical protein
MLKFEHYAACKRFAAVLAVTGLGLAGTLAASHAEQVGTAVVNGRIVVLDSNGTWTYKDDASDNSGGGSTNCETLKHIQVCLDTTGWSKANLPGDFVGSYRSSSKYFLGIVYEPSGSNDGYTYEFLQDAILQNAAHASGTTPENIPILDTNKNSENLDGFRSITYNPTINGAPFVFHNIFKIYPDRAVQFAFWAIGKQYTDDFADKVEKFTKSVSFKE